MVPEDLAKLISKPETHRKVVGEYKGAYSLGVTTDPDAPEAPAFLLRVEGAGDEFPSHVDVGGQRVRVIVKGGFQAPKPF